VGRKEGRVGNEKDGWVMRRRRVWWRNGKKESGVGG
jgi:hypothetical protein